MLMAVIVRGESCGYKTSRIGVRMNPPPAPTSVPKTPTPKPSSTNRAAVLAVKVATTSQF
jgi:hypothetical protein